MQQSSKYRYWIGGSTVLVSGLLAIGLGAAKSQGATLPPAEKAALHLAGGDVATVEPRVLGRTIAVSGSVEPVDRTLMKSKIAAVVDHVYVREGDVVRKGQLLATFDPLALSAQLRERASNLEMARAQLTLDEKNLRKSEALLKQGFISQSAFDGSSSTVDVSRAKVKAMQAQVEVATDSFNATQVRAPIGGVVSKRFIQPGERVDTNDQLLSIVDLSTMELQVQVPTADIAQVDAAQSVDFFVEGLGTRPFTGHVQRIEPEADSTNRAITVFISVGNADGRLRGGMFASGQLSLAHTQAALAIPINALQSANGLPFVYRVQDGKVVRRYVGVARQDERSGYAEISTGLASGDTVIKVKMGDLKEGTKVTIGT